MKKIFFILFSATFIIISCEEDLHKPYSGSNAEMKPVVNATYEATPGGAHVKYDLPAIDNIQYVLGEIKSKKGVIRQFKSSQYTNDMMIEGLPDTSIYELKLYTISKGEKKSEPIVLNIKPKLPPFLAVYKTLNVAEDFGGVNVKLLNASKAEIGVVVLYTDSLNNLVQHGSHYTDAEKLSHSFRGMSSKQSRIGVFVRDRWDNSSDTLFTLMTPLFEKMLEKSKFKDITLPGDAIIFDNEPNLKKPFLWDNSWSSDFDKPYGTYRNFTTNDSNDGRPVHFTMDLGVSAVLSRIRVSNYYQYTNRNMRVYEVWGHPGPPPADGSWQGWVKLADYEQVKPSGLPPGQFSLDDKKAWGLGDNINFPTDIGKMRYIRIKCLKNYIGNGNVSIAELTFWGSDN